MTKAIRQVLRSLVCFVRGHVVNEGEFIDSHDCWDSLSFCERCGKYDV